MHKLRPNIQLNITTDLLPIRLVHSLCTLLALFAMQCGPALDDTHHRRIFRYNQPEGITTLDPAFARSQANIWAVNQLFNGLTELDSQLMVQPALAERWEVSEDRLNYTFYLRRGIFFHEDAAFAPLSTRAFTAYDVVYSFKRLVDPVTASPGAWIFLDKVYCNSPDDPDSYAFTVVDSFTVSIKLKKTFPAFLELLAMPYAFIVPQEACFKYGKEFRMHPVGTGPFRFDSWEEGVHLNFIKNTRYWRSDTAGIPYPYLDAVQISFISDKNQAFLTFMQRKLDFLSDLSENAREMLLQHDGTLQAAYQSKIQLIKGPYLNTEYLGFQTDSAFYEGGSHPLLDRKVRQALNYALDKVSMIEYVLYNKGTAATHGFVPPFLYGSLLTPPSGYPFDQTKALQLLQQAGYPGGKGMPVLALYTTAQFPYKEIAEYIQKQWSAVGVKVKIETGATATIRERIDQGKVNLFRASWLGDYPDPENYLAVLYSQNHSPAGPNKMRFSDALFDSLYTQSLTIPTMEGRLPLYKKMDSLLLDRAPIVPLWYDEVVRIVHRDVQGLSPNPMNMLYLERVRKY